MDIRSKVEAGGERGLLGLAFDPNFKWNGRLFVYYTRNGGDIVVSRFVTNAAHTDVIESEILIELRARTHGQLSGLDLDDGALFHVAQMREGRVARVRVYLDRDQAKRAAETGTG